MQELQKKQAWYQVNQISIRKTDEQDYLTYCSDALFRIQILEQRLIRFLDLDFVTHIPFARSSKHRATVEQMYSKYTC